MVDVAPGSGRTVAGNILAMFTSRLASALAGLVSLPVVYGHLGTVEFGIWVVLSGLTGVIALADLGLGSAIVRQVAMLAQDGGTRRCRIALGVGLLWGAALAVVGAALVCVAWPLLAALLHIGDPNIGGAARWAVMALFLALLVDGISMPWRGVLEGLQRYSTLSAISGGSAVLGAVLAVIAVRNGGGLIDLGLTVAISSMLRAILVIAAARRCAPSLSPTLTGIGKDDLRSLGRYGIRVQVTSASGAMNVELDRFVLTGFFGPAVAGGFDLGGRVVNLFRIVPVFALVAMFPMAVSRAAQAGRGWLDQFVVVATKYMTAVAAVGAAGLVVCADPLIRMWLGTPNSWAAANIAVLAPAYALNLTAGTTGLLGRVEGLPGRETTYAALSVAINLVLTWPLLRLLGPIGVTLSTAIGVAIGTVYLLVSYHRFTRRSLSSLLLVMWPSIAAAVCAGLVANLLGGDLPDGPGRGDAALAVLCRGSVVLVVVALILAATRFVQPEDFNRFRALLRAGTAGSLPLAGGAG